MADWRLLHQSIDSSRRALTTSIVCLLGGALFASVLLLNPTLVGLARLNAPCQRCVTSARAKQILEQIPDYFKEIHSNFLGYHSILNFEFLTLMATIAIAAAVSAMQISGLVRSASRVLFEEKRAPGLNLSDSIFMDKRLNDARRDIFIAQWLVFFLAVFIGAIIGVVLIAVLSKQWAGYLREEYPGSAWVLAGSILIFYLLVELYRMCLLLESVPFLTVRKSLKEQIELIQQIYISSEKHIFPHSVQRVLARIPRRMFAAIFLYVLFTLLLIVPSISFGVGYRILLLLLLCNLVYCVGVSVVASEKDRLFSVGKINGMLLFGWAIIAGSASFLLYGGLLFIVYESELEGLSDAESLKIFSLAFFSHVGIYLLLAALSFGERGSGVYRYLSLLRLYTWTHSYEYRTVPVNAVSRVSPYVSIAAAVAPSILLSGTVDMRYGLAMAAAIFLLLWCYLLCLRDGFHSSIVTTGIVLLSVTVVIVLSCESVIVTLAGGGVNPVDIALLWLSIVLLYEVDTRIHALTTGKALVWDPCAVIAHQWRRRLLSGISPVILAEIFRLRIGRRVAQLSTPRSGTFLPLVPWNILYALEFCEEAAISQHLHPRQNTQY